MQVNRSDIIHLIEPHFEEYVIQESYKVSTIIAVELLTYLRFDLAFKLIYLDLLDKHVGFSLDAYKEHIRAFSLGRYNEPGNENKNSIEVFYQEFDKIYNNIHKNGFDRTETLIPLSRNGHILNGSHRVASAIKLNKDVACINLDTNPLHYDYKFFYDRNVPVNMLDAAAIKFVEYANNIYIACIWPTAQGYNEDIESVVPNIVYRKDVLLNYNGAHNFISQVYTGESWLGDVANNFQGAKAKLVECFKQKGAVRVVAFQADSLDVVLKVKEDIRSIFNVGKHSIHITDTKEEAINTARLIFNDNSVHFLNHAKPNKFLDFHKNLAKIKDFLQSNNIKEDDFALDGSMVLAAYGLRQAKDIDYFTSVDTDIIIPMDGFDSHDSELIFHKKDKDDLIYNPDNYFYFQGLKFVAFSQLFMMKKNRAEKKDINDCKIMQASIDNKFLQKKIVQIKQNIFYQKIIIKNTSIGLLKKTHLFRPIRSIYRLWRKSV